MASLWRRGGTSMSDSEHTLRDTVDKAAQNAYVVFLARMMQTFGIPLAIWVAVMMVNKIDKVDDRVENLQDGLHKMNQAIAITNTEMKHHEWRIDRLEKVK